jgi:denticleless
MLPYPNSSYQREAFTNCTNVASELIHGFSGLPTPPEHGLVKRPRPSNDADARPKRLKFTTERSRVEEENRVDSDQSEEDTDLELFMPRKKRTVLRARYALAMSRPGVTCRPLPCMSNSLPVTIQSLSLTAAVPTRSLLRAYVSSHKTDVFTCNSDRTDSFLTPPYACAYTHGVSSKRKQKKIG